MVMVSDEVHGTWHGNGDLAGLDLRCTGSLSADGFMEFLLGVLGRISRRYVWHADAERETTAQFTRAC